MSVKVMAAVWELKLTAPQLIVMLALADHADDEGRNAYPSLARLAWKTGYSESTVRRILKQLSDTAILDREERAGQTTMYTLHTGNGVKKQSYNARDNKGLQNDTPTIAMTPHPYHSYDTPTPTIAMTPESSIKPSPKHPSGATRKKLSGLNTPSSAMNPMKDAIAAAFGYDWQSMTKSEIGIVQRTAKQLCEAGRKPEDVATIYAYCRRRFDNFTAAALASHATAALSTNGQQMTQTTGAPMATDEEWQRALAPMKAWTAQREAERQKRDE